MSIGQIEGILIIANIYYQINGQTTSYAYGIGYRVSIKEPLILVAAELFDAKEFKEEWIWLFLGGDQILCELKTLENYMYEFLKKMNYLHFLHIFKFFLLHWERTNYY